MNAFIVEENFEGTGGVYFANHDIAARKTGALDLTGDEDLTCVTCHRCPDLDDMERNPRAVKKHLLEIGWYFETDSGRVTSDDSPFISRAGEVYRNWEEWLGERTGAAIRRRQKKYAEKELWGKWPWAEDIHVHIEPSGMVDALINLPYLHYGSIRYLEREKRLTCPNGDIAAYKQAYTINQDAQWGAG